MSLRIGVDVGGTHTDAAVVCGTKVLASAKVVTTSPCDAGVRAAVAAVLRVTDAAHVAAIMVGTTHFINALLQRRGLARVGVLRLCGEATWEHPPFCDLPPEVATAIGGHYALLPGGFEYDGTEAVPLDEAAVRAAAGELAKRAISCVVLSSTFGTVNGEHERQARAIVLDEYARVAVGRDVVSPSVTMSHELGGVGLLERENAGCLNECLRPLAGRTIAGLQRALLDLGLRCPVYLTQNDGTVASVEQAMAMPIRCVSSGPVNSVRGAALLSGETDCIVVDVGGTSTDFGVMVRGFPRMAASETYTAGVRTNFSMPDVHSIALGGGSLLQVDAASGDLIGIDSTSLGHDLVTQSACFGGGELTTSDVAVLLGHSSMGDRSSVAPRLSDAQATMAWSLIQQKLQEGIDAVKTSAAAASLVVVGGGAVLAGSAFDGIAGVVVPPNAGCANAVGAASAQVSGMVDRVVQLGGSGADAQQRAEAVLAAETDAAARAVAAGAVPGTISVLSRDMIPLAYLPGGSCRIRVLSVGDLAIVAAESDGSAVGAERPGALHAAGPGADTAGAGEEEAPRSPSLGSIGATVPETPVPCGGCPPPEGSLEPDVRDGVWTLGPRDVEAVALGCGILGTGGGGSPYLTWLLLAEQLRKRPAGAVRVVPLARLPEGGMVAAGGMMGAPTVWLEKLFSGEPLAATRAAAAACGVAQLAGVCSTEIGGSNGLMPLYLACHLGVPVVDGDLMGRAFPQLNHTTTAIYGEELTPAALADARGNELLTSRVRSTADLEALMRPVCTAMGCLAGFCTRPLPKEAMARVLIPAMVSQAWRLGQAVLAARRTKADPVEAARREYANGRLLCVGKVVDVWRVTTGGFARGSFQVAGLGAAAAGSLCVEFQNENLVARDGAGVVLASVPDLICCLETSSGRPVATEELRYGLRLSVLALPAPPALTTDEALRVLSPAAFGYKDVSYRPVGEYVPPRPVVV